MPPPHGGRRLPALSTFSVGKPVDNVAKATPDRACADSANFSQAFRSFVYPIDLQGVCGRVSVGSWALRDLRRAAGAQAYAPAAAVDMRPARKRTRRWRACEKGGVLAGADSAEPDAEQQHAGVAGQPAPPSQAQGKGSDGEDRQDEQDAFGRCHARTSLSVGRSRGRSLMSQCSTAATTPSRVLNTHTLS